MYAFRIAAALALGASVPALAFASEGASAALVADQAGAAQPAPQVESEITVTGRRQAITTMLKSVLSESGDGQLGRFETRVCPGVAGLPDNYSTTIVGLIRANAQAAGLKLEAEGCRPNAVAVFVSDPLTLVKGWKEKDPSLFGGLKPREVAELTRQAYPIVSWRVMETMAHDGTTPDQAGSVSGAGPTRGGTQIIRNALPSRMAKNVRQDIRLSLAVVDSRKTAGKTLQQLADIATLHLFLDIAPDAGEKARRDSILSLFSQRQPGTPVPTQLSASDRGMLSGLYRSNKNNLSGHQQRGRMVREINREAEKDN